MRSKFALSLLLVALFVQVSSLSRVTTADEPPGGSSPITVSGPDSFAQEWAEVRAKYPRVAVAHLKMREALSEGVAFARITNTRAFQTSAFRKLIMSLCERPEETRPRFCTLLSEPPRPQPNCPNCTPVCSAGVAPVDCAECLQKKGDAGCL
jgi:hypothetical protein